MILFLFALFCYEVILLQIFILLCVTFSGLKLRWCKKNDKYQVCPNVNICQTIKILFSLRVKSNELKKIKYKDDIMKKQLLSKYFCIISLFLFSSFFSHAIISLISDILTVITKTFSMGHLHNLLQHREHAEPDTHRQGHKSHQEGWA